MRSKFLVGDIAEINSESLKKNHSLSPIKYLDTSSVTENRFDEPEILEATKAPSRAKRIVRDKDIIISTVRPNLKHFGFIEKPDDNLIVSTGFAVIRCNDNIVEPRYLYSYLSLNKTTDYLSIIAEGSTTAYPSIKPSVIADMEVELPPLPTQKKIAHILSTLDDKIELNRKMNATLEAMAQAIFKSWFVDFDPVDAKAQAKSEAELETAAAELGISREMLDLFPSAFVESEMGMIPAGWRNDYLSSFVEILDSKRIPLSKGERAKRQGDVPYYGATSIMDYVDNYLFDEPLTLVGEDGSVVRDDGTPFMQYIWGKAWVNNHAHVLKSKSTLSTEAIYIALLKQNVNRFVTGAVQPKINQTNLKKIPIINPGDKLYTVYSKLIAPMFAKIRQLSDETETLQKTRDTLLPQLLSGELDVSKIKMETR